MNGQMTKILHVILFLLPLTGFAQVALKTNSAEDSLRVELKQMTVMFESKEKEADRLTYLLTAKEMALRSTELADSIFQVLVAVQAYNFNENHKGNPADIDIYRALYKALERFNDPILKTLKITIDKTDKDLSTKTETMASKLCSRIKRNMTINEWNKFASQLPYEYTCETAK